MIRQYFPYYKRLLKLAMPLVLTQAGQTMVQLIDNAMVGRVGTTELAAASFANSIYIIIMLFGLGVFMGVTPLVGHARGAEDATRVASIMKNGFALSGILLVGITAISLALVWAMPHMGQPVEVVELAIPYYRILVFSTIPFLLFSLLKQVGEGLGNTILAMIATISANLVNIGLNYVLIYGKLGFPELGLMGAGYATLIARIIMPFILYAGFMRIQNTREYFKLMRTVQVTRAEVKHIFSVGLPIAGQLVMEVSAFALSSVMMGWLGAVALALPQIALGYYHTGELPAGHAQLRERGARIVFGRALGGGLHGAVRRGLPHPAAPASVHLYQRPAGDCASGFAADGGGLVSVVRRHAGGVPGHFAWLCRREGANVHRRLLVLGH